MVWSLGRDGVGVVWKLGGFDSSGDVRGMDSWRLKRTGWWQRRLGVAGVQAANRTKKDFTWKRGFSTC